MKRFLSLLVLACAYYNGFGQTDPMVPSLNMGYSHINPAYFLPETKFSGNMNLGEAPTSVGSLKMLSADLNVYKNHFRQVYMLTPKDNTIY